ncbi:MAG TPA: iron-containing redox enzyme family protein [Candidatus Polarisedimenticolia bacterium]|nr:iron-containing redox enzyme family protein [Candidatus Polarisedimenticolia bacterium]
MLGERLQESLKNHPLRKKLISHPFFDKIRTAPLSRGQVATFLGQWWHPLHYFPVFLSRLISVSPRVELQTAISKILYQELGEGDAQRAHEVLYVSTMTPLGFSRSEVACAAPFPATARLVAAYAESSADLMAGLGFMYGTEVADLAMVSGIGTAVRRATGAGTLPWVDIHVEQEPEHVARANDSLSLDLTEAQEKELLAHAESMWRHWVAFFDELERAAFASQALADVTREARRAEEAGGEARI